MADQSNLTITGIGGDPSGSHPIGNLNQYWVEAPLVAATMYVANSAMAAQAATTESAEDYVAYSESLYLTNIPDGTRLVIAAMATAETLGCWQWYNPATSGVDADFTASAALGTAATFGNGTWTNIGTPAQDYADATLDSEVVAEALALRKGVALRMSLSIVDGADDGVASGLVNAAVAIINAGYVLIPMDALADSNRPIVALGSETTAGSIGGIGADPS